MKRFRKKPIIVLLLAALAAASFSGCRLKPRKDLVAMLHQMSEVGPVATAPLPTAPKPETENEDGSDTTWTVMLYLCGSDLESEVGAATQNIEEILSAGWSTKVNFLIETGGSRYWHTRGISPTRLQRFKVGSTGLEKLEDLPLASMGETETLSDFLRWGGENYPADKYMLIFWNHGGGSIGGTSYDEKFWGDSLILTEMEEAVKASGLSFELFGFDCCLMASLETANLLSPYGKYMVGSEESEPTSGWNYTTWLKYLYENPGASGEELGKNIADGYMKKSDLLGAGYMATCSVLDLAAVPAVHNAFKNMAAEMMNTTSDVEKLRSLVQAARGTEAYGGQSYFEGYSDMIDLGDLVRQTKEILPITTQAVEETLDRAVLYNLAGDNRERAHGLSVFYPLGDTEYYADEYCTVTDNISYLRFIDVITDSWSAPDWVYEGTTRPAEVDLGDGTYEYGSDDYLGSEDSISSDNYRVEMDTRVTNEGYYEMTITSGREIISAVDYDLAFLDWDKERCIFLGTDADVEVEWSEGLVRDKFEGRWMSIDGKIVSAILIDETADYVTYAVPVKVNGDEMYLRARYDYKTKKFTLIEVYGGINSETGMSARDGRPLEDGDELTFLFYGISLKDIRDEQSGLNQVEGMLSSSDTELETYEEGTTTYREGKTEMKWMDLDDGNYLYNFVAVDLFGNQYDSDAVLMTVDGEEVVVTEF